MLCWHVDGIVLYYYIVVLKVLFQISGTILKLHCHNSVSEKCIIEGPARSFLVHNI